MSSNSFADNFNRDVLRFKEEISLYRDDVHLWKEGKGINNPAGTIALHLLGNLNYWIGNILGGSGFKRDRDSEFTQRNVSREAILNSIDETMAVVQKTLSELPEDRLNEIYPSDILEKEVTTEHFLIYLISHLNYHVGQINYHRRMLE